MRLLFDDLVGAGEDRWRHGEAKRLRGLEIDDQLELGRLLDWQIGRSGAFENPPDVSTDIVIGVGQARSITDQAAGGDVYAKVIDGRNGVAGRERRDLFRPAEKERVADDEGAGLQLDER